MVLQIQAAKQEKHDCQHPKNHTLHERCQRREMHKLTKAAARLHTAEHRGEEQVDTCEPDKECEHHHHHKTYPPDKFPQKSQHPH